MKVRLTNREIDIIKSEAMNIFGNCKVYIFGSRLIDKQGGDIDIFIAPQDKTNLFAKRVKLSAKLENMLGKPVDVIVSRNKNREIEKEAMKGIRV